MSVDKTTPTVGKLLTGGERRDAVHFALAPVIAACALEPGDRARFVKGSTEKVCDSSEEDALGIIDPFLTDTVHLGQRCWLFLYPVTAEQIGKIDQALKNESEAWLRDYAKKKNNYDDPEWAFQRLLEGLRSGELYFYGSVLYGLDELPDADELHFHAERYLGIRID